MNSIRIALSELSRLRSKDEPIVSLYLNVRWNDEAKRERTLLTLREQSRRALGHTLPDGPGMHGLRRTLGRIEAYVESLTEKAVPLQERGLALFACEELGLWRELRVGFDFEDALETDGFPHLLELARVIEDGVPAIVVVTNAQGADVYRAEMGAIALAATLRGEVPHSDVDTFDAGTSMPGHMYERVTKNDRRDRTFIRKNRQAGAHEATLLFDQDPKSAIVLVGTAENVAAFEKELPERARERVLARFPRPRAWEKDGAERRAGVLEEASAAVAEVEAREAGELVDHLVGEALRGGLAVLGPSDVVNAVNERRVHRLVIGEHLDGTGWECSLCNALGANAEAKERCPYCDGELHVLRNLAQAIVARTLAEKGEVEVVSSANKLLSYRGVGAFMRQAGGTGQRGAKEGWTAAPGAGEL